MPPITYIQAQSDNSEVTHLRLVVHVDGVDGAVSNNHWSIYLLLQDNTSIRMNMKAVGYGDITGRLEWSKHDYILTNSTIKKWDFPVPAGILVAHFATLIYGLGRQNYDMSGGGSGCRWWWLVLI